MLKINKWIKNGNNNNNQKKIHTLTHQNLDEDIPIFVFLSVCSIFIYYIVNRFVFHLLGALSCNLAVRESTLFHRLFATAYFCIWNNIEHTQIHTHTNVPNSLAWVREKERISKKTYARNTARKWESERERAIENMVESVSVCMYASMDVDVRLRACMCEQVNERE